MRTIKEAQTKYENLPDNKRMELQNEFGNYGIPSRERKFYSWLLKNKRKLK